MYISVSLLSEIVISFSSKFKDYAYFNYIEYCVKQVIIVLEFNKLIVTSAMQAVEINSI